LSVLGFFSSKKEALQFAIKNNLLIMLVGNSLAMTRAECFDRRDEPMNDVAIEQFDYLLDGIADGIAQKKRR
jgi:hypothetical protein